MWFRKKQPEPEPTLEERLVDAEARLARYEQLPDEAFTVPPSPRSPIVRHGIDEKPKAIAYVKADIAALEVRIAAATPTTKEKEL